MISVIQGFDMGHRLAVTMFEDRKRLFVDLLDWDLPVTNDRYEIDAFDGDHAIYVAAAGASGEHIGSMRLLPSTRPHILGSLFPALCDGPVPVGRNIFEITRLCLPARLGAAKRLHVRNQLISAMTDHALGTDLATLTGVVGWDFLKAVLRMGWRCAPLGGPTVIGGARLGAFRIDLDGDTIGGLARGGIYTPGTISLPLGEAA